jgi:nucleoside-diphosphate-sugar epimerase
MDWNDNHCLVTGGAGFIGSNLAETLVRNGAQVTVLDDLSTGRETNLERLRELGVEFVRGSILDERLLAKTFAGVEYVFHQAAFVSVPRSVVEPGLCNEVNVTGTLRVLEAAREAGVKKVVYAASSSAYGETPTLPKVEGMSPSPLSPYAVAKLTGEYYCAVYNSVYGLPTTALRYFNVYGPRQDPASQYAAVVPKFITAAAQGKALVIYGDGEQSRDFTFVADAVQANLKAALSSEADGAVVNVAVGERTTINELAAMVIRLVGAEVEPEHLEPRVGDIRHSLADISRARKLMGYEPQYNLERGLRKTVRFFTTV